MPSSSPTTTTGASETGPTVTIIGPEEMVYDFSADRCDDGARPDLPPRVYRTIDGNLNLTMADPANFRMVGQDFDSLVPICPLIRDSAYNPDPANYAHFEWLASTYTEDGSTIHAVIHNEFHGDEAAGWLSRADFSLEQGDRDWSYLGPIGWHAGGAPGNRHRMAEGRPMSDRHLGHASGQVVQPGASMGQHPTTAL